MFPGIPEVAQEFVVCKHPWGYNVPNPTITGAFMLEYDAITIKIDDKRLDHGGKRMSSLPSVDSICSRTTCFKAITPCLGRLTKG